MLPMFDINDWINIMPKEQKIMNMWEEFDRIFNQWKDERNFPGIYISKEKLRSLEKMLNAVVSTNNLKESGQIFADRLEKAQGKLLAAMYEKKFEELTNQGTVDTNASINLNLVNESDIQAFIQEASGRTNINVNNFRNLYNSVFDRLSMVVTNSNQQTMTLLDQMLQQFPKLSEQISLQATKDFLAIYGDFFNSEEGQKISGDAMTFTQSNISNIVKVISTSNKTALNNEIEKGAIALRGMLVLQSILDKATPKTTYSMKDLGDAFEIVLANYATMINDGIVETSGNLINGTITSAVTGADLTASGERIRIDARAGFKQEQHIVRLKNDKGKELTPRVFIHLNDVWIKDEKNGFLSRKNKYSKETKPLTVLETTSLSSDSARQGKMDVIWHIPDGKNEKTLDLRISAKNWSKLSDHDLGSTSILYAIIRSSSFGRNLSLEAAQFYEMGLQDYGLGEGINIFHDFAKLCAALDIAMGFSQGADGYANILVVYDQQTQYFYVRSMMELLDTLFSNAYAAISVQGYNDRDLELLAQQIRNRVILLERSDPQGINSTQLYFSYMHQLLNQVEVSIAVKADAFRALK